MNPRANEEGLRQLRESRREILERVRAQVKEQNRLEKMITEALGKGPKTVPEISLETGISAQAVLWHVMAMKKYGRVTEVEAQGSYFSYSLKEA